MDGVYNFNSPINIFNFWTLIFIFLIMGIVPEFQLINLATLVKPQVDAMSLHQSTNKVANLIHPTGKVISQINTTNNGHGISSSAVQADDNTTVNMSKTSISILQELMIKQNRTVQFDLLYQGGPPHQMIFRYQCTASGVSVVAGGRSKKDAKQESARLCLEELAARGLYTAPATHSGPFSHPSPKRVAPPTNEDGPMIYSYVALLKEYCDEFRLPGPEYELISDTGPPHLREFEVRARVGSHTRTAVASTKKVARQIAAERLYKYLKEHLTNVTHDFVEDEAMVRANQRAQEKYIDTKEDTLPWRPNLGQKISEYHLGIKNYVDEDRRKAALAIIKSITPTDNPVVKAEEVLTALGMEWEWEQLQSYEKGTVIVVLHVPKAYPSVAITSPPDVYAVAVQNTARQLIEYLKLMM